MGEDMVSAYLDISTFGYLDFWISGLWDIWIFGYLDVWIFRSISGTLDIWIWGDLDIWIFGYLVTFNLLLHPHSEMLCGAALPGAFLPDKTRPWCFVT